MQLPAVLLVLAAAAVAAEDGLVSLEGGEPERGAGAGVLACVSLAMSLAYLLIHGAAHVAGFELWTGLRQGWKGIRQRKGGRRGSTMCQR